MGQSIPGPHNGSQVYGFTKPECARIARVVNQVEGYYQNRQPRRARWPAGGGGGGWAFADSGAGTTTGGTRSSPKTATGTLLEVSGSGPGLGATGSSVTYYNLSATAIGASKTIVLGFYQGKWYVVQVLDC
jgi:hypothetical protein